MLLIVDDAVAIEDVEPSWRTAGFAIERGRVGAVHAKNGRLDRVELTDGRTYARGALLYAPERRQVEIVHALKLETDDDGHVVVDDSAQTSVQGIYAAGDLTTPRSQIVFAASAGAGRRSSWTVCWRRPSSSPPGGSTSDDTGEWRRRPHPHPECGRRATGYIVCRPSSRSGASSTK